MMIEWILRCELKRKTSKNINGTVTRQMRECLIKLYCTLGEIQKQKEEMEAVALKKELAVVNKSIAELREENLKLRQELEHIKSRVGEIPTPINRKEMHT